MTEAQMDLVERLQLEAADSWESHSPIARELMQEAAAELTACRAEQARLQEERDWEASLKRALLPYQERAINAEATVASLEVQLEEVHRTCDKAEEQVSTLTAALQRLIKNWRENAFEREQRAKDEGDLIECADELAAVLRAASEGA